MEVEISLLGASSVWQSTHAACSRGLLGASVRRTSVPPGPPTSGVAALAKRGTGLGALGAMAAKDQIQQCLWRRGSISRLPQPGLSQPLSPGHGF